MLWPTLPALYSDLIDHKSRRARVQTAEHAVNGTHEWLGGRDSSGKDTQSLLTPSIKLKVK